MTTGDGGAPGVVLAGGLARRMGGGDKPLVEIGGRTILARVIACLEPQCECLAINANGDPRRFASFGLPVVADGVPGHPGPLAGILAALDWAAANRPNAAWILSAPGDCPFLPRDLVARLSQALIAENAEIAVGPPTGNSSRHRAVARRLAGCAAPGADRRRPAQGRRVDRALPVDDRRLANRAARPVLQHQHRGRSRRGGTAGGDRRSPLAMTTRTNPVEERVRSRALGCANAASEVSAGRMCRARRRRLPRSPESFPLRWQRIQFSEKSDRFAPSASSAVSAIAPQPDAVDLPIPVSVSRSCAIDLPRLFSAAPRPASGGLHRPRTHKKHPEFREADAPFQT